MKKFLTIGITALVALSLAACGNSSSNDSSDKPEKATKVDASKESSKKAADSSKAVAKKSTTETIPTTADKDWFFNKSKNIFYAGNETMTLTKSEVRDGIDNTKVLVIYTTILNNSKKEQDPSNFYMVVHAKQKTDTSNVSLDPGMLNPNDDGTSPLQEQEDNLNNALLPGKSIETALMFELKNSNPVSVEFSDADMMTTLGTKTYDVE